MFALTPGELGLVLFIFALVWGAGVLPRAGERFGQRIDEREHARSRRNGG